MKTFIGLLLVWIFLLSVSCQSVKQISARKNLPPLLTENRILKNIEENAPDFQSFYAKKADVTLLDGKGKSRSFKASIKVKRDSFIQINATAPLGIEIGRVLFTRDSIKVIDTYHKKYLLADYAFLYNKFDMQVDFKLLENILTNSFFEFDLYLPQMKKRNFRVDRKEGGYELSNMQEKALSRKMKKIYKKRKKNKDFIVVLEKILVDSETFRPLLASAEDMDDFAGIRIDYGSFQPCNSQVFPHTLSINLFSSGTKLSLGLDYNKLEFNVPVRPSFRISPKYKRIILPYEIQ